MPAAAFANFHVYGPAQSASVITSAASVASDIAGFARAGVSITGVASVPLAKPTRLVNRPATITAGGTITQALPKGRARPTATIRVNSLSQDDVTGAVLEAPVEGGVSLKQALRLMLAYVSGNATGLDGNPAFKSLDGTKDRIAGTISGGSRTVTTRDPT
jgi:hypothetical protein